MIRRSFLPTILVLLFLTVCVAVEAGETVAGPPLVVVDWTPPTTTIPQQYIDAVKALLGNGLSDPRGGEFHRFKIKIGDAAWSSPSDHLAYGWIKAGAKQAVAVDGLTYDMVEDLGSASLQEFLKPDEKDKWNNNPMQVDAMNVAVPALLLVRGETALAETGYARLNKAMDIPVQLFSHLMDRYKMQVAQYLMSREDRQTLPWAERLVMVSVLHGKSVLQYPKHASSWQRDPEEPEQIYRDVVRRAGHPKPPVDLEAIRKLEQPARIAALMDTLDEVAATQWGQPGGLDWSQDPVLKAIAAEKEAVVPALIDVIEHDDRLTRSVSFHRDFFPGRHIATVRTAAWIALNSVWPVAQTVTDTPSGERAARLREFWARSAGLTPAERWLAVLRDETATPRDWLAAAERLTERADNIHLANTTYIGNGENPGMAGEPLRVAHGDEITQLMAQRARAIVPLPKSGSSSEIDEYRRRLDLVRCLVKWDASQALAPLQEASAGAKQVFDLWGKAYAFDPLSRPYSLVITDRISLRDDTALADYEDLLQRAAPKDVFTSALAPLWIFPDNADLQKIGAAYFARFAAQLTAQGKDDSGRGTYELSSRRAIPLIKSPAYREFIAGLLKSDLKLGTAHLVMENKQGSITYGYGSERNNGGMGLPPGVDPATLPKEDVDFTLGDFVATEFNSYHTAPAFVMVWPKAERARAKAEISKWLLDPAQDWNAILKEDPFSGAFSD